MTVRSENGRNHCSDHELEVLLSGEDTSDLFCSAAAHLETCVMCREKLTQRTGDPNHWSEVREMLSPVEGDHPESGELWRYRTSDHNRASAVTIDEASVRQLLAAPSHPEMLGRLGRYEIERIIGSGGMGVVLKGFDTELNRPVAVKLLAPHLARVGAARQRFAREARAVAAVVHEHVVAIHSVESDADCPFLVMQYVAGESLQARVDHQGPLAVNEILRIASQVAAGLAAAHRHGIVHRDIKPANILLECGIDRAFLTDFGLARVVDDATLTQTGIIAGTPHYMSPEQASGEAISARSDLFSLGAAIYFMATGHPPFRAERAMAVLHRICRDRHRPLWQLNGEIPDELSVLVDRLLEKRPARRFDSADAVRIRLVELLGLLQQPRTGILRRMRRFFLRYPGRSLVAVVVFVVAALGLAWWLTPPLSPVLARPVAGNGDSDDGHKLLEAASFVAPAFSAAEARAFADSARDLRERLSELNSDRFETSAQAEEHQWSDQVQSIHQRLDQLQRGLTFESQPMKTGDEK